MRNVNMRGSTSFGEGVPRVGSLVEVWDRGLISVIISGLCAGGEGGAGVTAVKWAVRTETMIRGCHCRDQGLEITGFSDEK
ncbi:hypothetical protein QG37_06590 [Candidozyma auris]|nr:hypothetical protein QG37_06590 [[Candida] auris]